MLSRFVHFIIPSKIITSIEVAGQRVLTIFVRSNSASDKEFEHLKMCLTPMTGYPAIPQAAPEFQNPTLFNEHPLPPIHQQLHAPNFVNYEGNPHHHIHIEANQSISAEGLGKSLAVINSCMVDEFGHEAPTNPQEVQNAYQTSLLSKAPLRITSTDATCTKLLRTLTPDNYERRVTRHQNNQINNPGSTECPVRDPNIEILKIAGSAFALLAVMGAFAYKKGFCGCRKKKKVTKPNAQTSETKAEQPPSNTKKIS